MNRIVNRAKNVNRLNGRGLAAAALAVVLGGVLAGGTARADIPEPDHIFYGPVPEGAESVLVTIAAEGVTLSTYAIGVSAGGQFVLRLPMDSSGERSPGRARPGDEAAFHVDGERVASATVGEPGVARLVELAETHGGEGIGIRDVSVVEGDEGTVDAVFELSLAEPRDERVMVFWTVEQGTASLGEDFLGPDDGASASGPGDRRRPSRRVAGGRRAMLPGNWESLEIAPGAASQRIVVRVNGDRREEPDETFFVHLVRSIGAPIDREVATCTIVDDDGAGTPTILVAGSRFLEGEAEGAGVALRLSRAVDHEVSVDWATVDQLATAGEDFVAASGTLTFAPGETSRWIGLTILDDAEPEPDDRFLVVFSQPVNATLDSTEAVLTILDDDGPAGPELKRVPVTRQSQRTSFARPHADPVVILGPPTNRTAEVDAVGVQAIDGLGFDLLLFGSDGASRQAGAVVEDVSYLVVERGMHLMEDGSVWEAGTLELERSGTWTPRAFARSFPGSPALLLTVQGARGDAVVAVRARSVGADGFEAAAFGPPPADGEEGSSVVGYLAVYSPAGSGTLRIGGEPTPYLLQRPTLIGATAPVTSWRVAADAGPSVSGTTLDVLVLGGHLFARETGDGPGRMIAIHARPPEHGAPLEWGTAESIGESWTTIPLSRRYDSAVIVAKPVVAPGETPCSVRVRNVSAGAFDVRCEPWAAGASCSGVRVSYLVAEEGTHELAGLEVRAGALRTDRRLGDGWQAIGLGEPFLQVPVVLAGVQTDNNPGVRARIHNRNVDWFDIGLECRADAGGAVVPETVGWIALEPGTVTTSDSRRVEAFSAEVGRSRASDPRPPVGRRPPGIPVSAVDATTARVTIAGTGSTYFEAPTLVCLESARGGETVVVAPGDEQADVAEDVCVLRAD